MTSKDYIQKITKVYNQLVIQEDYSMRCYTLYFEYLEITSSSIKYLFEILKDIKLPYNVLYIDDYTKTLVSENISRNYGDDDIRLESDISSDIDIIDVLSIHLIHACAEHHKIQIEELQQEYHKDRCDIINIGTELFPPLCRIIDGY